MTAADFMKTAAARELQTERDAIFLWAAEHPFTRWREVTEGERDRYRRKARRVADHLAQYEGVKA